MALGVLFGAAVGAVLAYLIVAMGNPYLWQIVLPGTLLGIIVGYATQRHLPAPGKRWRDRSGPPAQPSQGATMQGSFKALMWCAALSLAAVQAAAAQSAPAAQPGAEHKPLGYFVGKWTTEGEMKPGPMGPGGKLAPPTIASGSRAGTPSSAAPRARAVGDSRSMGILGYSPEEKVYTYYGVNNTPMGMPSVPKGTFQDGTWTYTDEGTMGGRKYKSRVTIEEVSPTAYTFQMAIQGGNGKW